VRWYVAYSLSLRDLEEMMAERGIGVVHSTVHRWVFKLLPVFEKAFRLRQRPVGDSWRMDDTYILVKGQWKYLYRAVDRAGKTIDTCCGRAETPLLPGASSKRPSPRTEP
jgi:transposase-like protein